MQTDVKSLISAITKKVPKSLTDMEDGAPDYGVITTGSIAVDAVTVVGGFPRGRVTEVAGWEASAKTTLFMTAAAKAIQRGLYVAFLDNEKALDFDFAKSMGVDVSDRSKFLYLTPDTFEESAELIQILIREDAADLIGVDSVSAMIPKSVFDGEIGGNEAMAIRARLMSAWMPRMIHEAKESERKPAIVLINQLRNVIPTNAFASRFGPKTTTSGGVAIRFYSSIRLSMKQVRKGFIVRKAEDPFRPGKELEIPVANEHEVSSDKNKVGSAYRKAPLWVRYDETLPMNGIDNVWTLMDMAIAADLIDSKGGGIYVMGEVKMKGAEAMHAHLFAHPEACQELAAALGLDWANYAPFVPPQSE